MMATLSRLRKQLYELYHGGSPTAARFGYSYIVADLAIIAFFIAAPLFSERPWFLAVDYFIAAVLAVDLVARALAARKLGAFARNPFTWIDFFVLLTLLLPQYLFNLAFLRVLDRKSVV